MTKEEAIVEMLKGKRITHPYFSDGEWITMKDDYIITEQGYKIEAYNFWKYRPSKAFEQNWEIKETIMKTFLGKNISPLTKGILYICLYDHTTKTINVIREIEFRVGYQALEAFANTPNPESQLAYGKTQDSFERELRQLHANLNNPQWVKDLSNYL